MIKELIGLFRNWKLEISEASRFALGNSHRRWVGFTLIELLLVMAIISILAGAMLLAINPGRQLAKARDTQRESDVYAILSAVYQYQSEHTGNLPDTDGNPTTSNFPTTLTCIGTDPSCFDLAAAGDPGETVVPYYLAEMPKDPKPVNPGEGTDANTGYLIQVNSFGRLVASASGETKSISVTR